MPCQPVILPPNSVPACIEGTPLFDVLDYRRDILVLNMPLFAEQEELLFDESENPTVPYFKAHVVNGCLIQLNYVAVSICEMKIGIRRQKRPSETENRGPQGEKVASWSGPACGQCEREAVVCSQQQSGWAHPHDCQHFQKLDCQKDASGREENALGNNLHLALFRSTQFKFRSTRRK